MNGMCPTLDCFYGTQRGGDGDGWYAIQVYRDGNPIVLGGLFKTEEEAEDCATLAHESDLEARKIRGQFGLGA